MSNMEKYYNDNSEDYKERKKRREFIYSSKDYIPGIRGLLIKLLVSFIIFSISTSIQMVSFSTIMMFKEMQFILLFSIILILIVWVVAAVLKKSRNIFKLLVIFSVIAVAYFLSPYNLTITIIVLVINLFTSLIALSRLNIPEKIAFSPILIISSCILICAYQIIFLFDVFKIESAMEIKSILMIVGIIWIILSIFILNLLNINRITSDNQKISKSLIYGNLTLTVLFSGLVLIISSIGSYKEFILNIIRSIILFIFRGSEEEDTPIVESAAPQQGGFDIRELGTGETSPFWEFMEKVALIIIVIICAAILYFLIKKIIKMIKNGVSLLFDYLKGNDAKTNYSKYDDVEESTFDKIQFNDAIKKRFENLRRKFKRKQKLSDMKNNNQKVRLIYKYMLEEKDNRNETVAKNITAREFLFDENVTIEKRTFLNGYEKARYSNHTITDKEVEAGINLTGKQK